jgi:hypothetical protein
MNLSELYKNPSIHSEKVKFRGNDIEIKLFLEKEAELMEGKEVHEQLAMCIIEGGKTLAESGGADVLRDNMPLAHKKELMELIMSTNGISVSFDEKKSN